MKLDFPFVRACRSSLLMLFISAAFAAGQSAPDPQMEKPPAREQATKPETPSKTADADEALERAVTDAGNDIAARVKNLEEYLKKFPDAPRRPAVYRALAEACVQLRDFPKAIDYAERLIAIRPEDSAMMLFVTDLLEKQGDAQSLTKAAGYATRVIERIEKDPIGEKSPRTSQEEWEQEQQKLKMSLYLLRGRVELQRKNYEAAASDLSKSYALVPNTPAALRLGEIFELQKQYDLALEHYANAFVLPDSFGTLQDQLTARRNLGNIWKLTRGSEAGLGDYLLAAYDRVTTDEAKGRTPQRNVGVKDLFAMEVRRLNGELLKLSDAKGKVVVMYFWATWCGPCRELEPLMEAAYEQYERNLDVVFLALSRDEDEALVAPFIKKEKLRIPVYFADGTERVLRVEAIPTVLIFDRSGAIIYRAEGFEPEGFLAAIREAITRALAASTKATN